MSTFNTSTWTGYLDNNSSKTSRKYRGVITYTLSSPTVKTYKLEITKFEIEQTSSASSQWSGGTAGIEVTPTGKTKGTRTIKLSSSNKWTWTDSGKKTISTSAMSYTFDKKTSAQTITVSVKAYKSTASGLSWSGSVTSSFNFTVPALPISTVKAGYSSIDIGDTQDFTITRSGSNTYTHTLKMDVGGNISTIGTGIGTSLTYQIPSTIGEYIQDSTSAIAKVTCETYSGSTLVGTSSTSFTILVPESWKPVFSSPPITLTETATLPSAFASVTESGKFIQKLSLVETQVNSSSNFATITLSTISFQDRMLTLYIAGEDKFGFRDVYGNIDMKLDTRDSRDRRTTTSYIADVLPYDVPNLTSVSYTQVDGKITVNISGSVSSVDNNNTCTLIIKHRAKGEEEFNEIVVYNKSKTYNINVTKEILDSTILKDAPYELEVILKDEVYDANPITKTIITNLSTVLFNSNKGWQLIDSNNKYRTCSYNNIDWSSEHSTELSSILASVIYDKNFGCNFAYSFNNDLLYYINDWNVLTTVSENVLGMCTGLNRTFWLTNNKIYWVNDDMSIGNKNIPEACDYIVGNDTVLYIISRSGDIYYITSRNDTWHEPEYPVLDDDRIITLKDYAPIFNAKPVSTCETIVLMANTNRGWRIIYTPTTSLR